MEISVSEIAELTALGIPVFIGCSVIMGNGDNLQNCFAKHEKLAVEEPAVGKPSAVSGNEVAVEVNAQDNFEMPAELTKPEIMTTLNKLQTNHVLDAHFQPIDLSIAKRGILASLVADKFDIENPWIVFGKLWNMNKETLRSGCNKAVLQPKSDETRKMMRNIIG